VQYSCKTKLRADGQAEVHVSSGEESEAVMKEKEEDGSEDEFVTERKEPSAEVGGAGREQGCVGAALQATKAGSW
jgi:hypothetical protein